MLFICLKNLVVIFCLWSHSSELGSLYLMKYPLKNFSNFAIFLEWKPTIHKKDFCLRQKYPSFRDILSSLVCHAGHKYPIHFAIEATFQVPFQLFHFFSRLTCFYYYNFLFILYYFLLVTSLVKNHATFGGRWRNLKTDSIFKLEKEVGLCKPPQVPGYFCLEQKSFLWIV